MCDFVFLFGGDETGESAPSVLTIEFASSRSDNILESVIGGTGGGSSKQMTLLLSLS